MSNLWERYNKHLCKCAKVGMSLDISRMDFDDDFFKQMKPAMDQAYQAMEELESGAIANPDENRMVGHYWLRAANLAPSDEIRNEIVSTLAAVKDFAAKVHAGDVAPPTSKKFTELLVIGIGGSALGPQLLADALGGRGGVSGKRDKMRVYFLDNTDPDGFNRTFAEIGGKLKSTLAVVISKSGGTPETRNGMLAAKAAYDARDLPFAKHAVAVTGQGSKLDNMAASEGWLQRFNMWDWVGGRTSVMSAVGLLPLALQGVDIDKFLAGATAMDEITRGTQTKKNPAALLALMWHHATNGRGEKDMVMLPYKDRLLLFSRYLQQLVMESLGKKHDLDGNVVRQGIAVYGNKGSTDQHAYVQQLRDGVNNFFVTFIVSLQDSKTGTGDLGPLEVEPMATAGDFLNGFWQGTRAALHEEGRQSMTLTVNRVDVSTLGALIALFERAVGLYATLVNINAYHQPGVEAGKKAAASVLDVQRKVIELVSTNMDDTFDAESLAATLNLPDDTETIHHLLQHLAANKRYVKRAGGKYRGIS